MAKRLTSRKLTKRSRPSTKSQFKPIKGIQRHSRSKSSKPTQSQRAYDKVVKKVEITKRDYEKALKRAEIVKRAYDKKSAKSAVAKRAEINKPIKSTSDIKEAVASKNLAFKKRFMSKSVNIKGFKGRGWNLMNKTYFFGGTAMLYASIDTGTPFPVDESAFTINNFKMSLRKTSRRYMGIRNNMAWYEAVFIKKMHKKLGEMTFEEAKREYEKFSSDEDTRYIDMVNQFNQDNKERAKVDKIKWFKLVGN